MDKVLFKKKVLAWLAENGIFAEKVRVYNMRKYGLEVRIYHAPMEYISERVSFRTQSVEDLGDHRFQRHGTRGHHAIRIPLYTAIGEDVFASKEEMDFTLKVLKDNCA